MKSQTRNAWAIHTQSREGHGFIGTRYLTSWDRDIPVQCDGNRTALFNTRDEARKALKRIKGPDWGFKSARIYRVQVTIAGMPA